MRPIIYASPRRRPSNSPYSAAEFPAAMTGKEGVQGVREMEWRMMRERVDMANHRFWVSPSVLGKSRAGGVEVRCEPEEVTEVDGEDETSGLCISASMIGTTSRS